MLGRMAHLLELVLEFITTGAHGLVDHWRDRRRRRKERR